MRSCSGALAQRKTWPMLSVRFPPKTCRCCAAGWKAPRPAAGDPDFELALIEEDLANPLMRMRLVSLDGRLFAYVQDHDIGAWPQDHLARLPEGTRAVDTFIGEPDMLGQGHGSAYLRPIARRLIAEGAPCRPRSRQRTGPPRLRPRRLRFRTPGPDSGGDGGADGVQGLGVPTPPRPIPPRDTRSSPGRCGRSPLPSRSPAAPRRRPSAPWRWRPRPGP